MTVWYDGAQRERDDAYGRITKDARAFLDAEVRAFANNSAAWSELVARAVGTALLLGIDGLDQAVIEAAPTAMATMHVDFRPDRTLAIHVDARWYPRRREAIASALSKSPWCASVAVGPQIEVTLRSLDADAARRVTRTIRRTAEQMRAQIRKGTEAFLAMTQPDAPPEISNALKTALEQVDAIESEKLATVF